MKTQKPLNLKRLSATTLTFITKVTNALHLAHTRHIALEISYSGTTKQISAGIRAQVMIVCDNLMAYDDESWEKVETEIEKLAEIKNTLSETVSGLYTFRHTIDTLNVNAGFKTHRIERAKRLLTIDTDRALAVLQSVITDFSESIRIFRNAKFTSKTERIKAQSTRKGQYSGM